MLPPVVLGALLALVDVAVSSASATTPPATGRSSSLSPSSSASLAAALYASRVLSWGLRGRSVAVAKASPSILFPGRNGCAQVHRRGRWLGSAYSFSTRACPPWQCPGRVQNSQIGSVSLTVMVNVLPCRVTMT